MRWHTCMHYLTTFVASPCSISMFLSNWICVSLTHTHKHTHTHTYSNSKLFCVFVYDFVHWCKCSLIDPAINCLWFGMRNFRYDRFRWILWWAMFSPLWSLQLCQTDQLSDKQISPWLTLEIWYVLILCFLISGLPKVSPRDLCLVCLRDKHWFPAIGRYLSSHLVCKGLGNNYWPQRMKVSYTIFWIIPGGTS